MDLGHVATVMAESFGEPGQRTFRVLAESGDGRVSLWIEKEQIVMLGTAISELLEQASPDRLEPVAGSQSATFMGELDVKVGSLSLGRDREAGEYRLTAGEFDTNLAVSSISFLLSRDQLAAVGQQIADIVSASRPRCVLCGRPLAGGPHFCPESNGHARLSRND